MSISFKTDISRINGNPKYIIEVETDIKDYFMKVQDTARFCIDDSLSKLKLPVSGEIAYDIDSHEFKIYNGLTWETIDNEVVEKYIGDNATGTN